MTCFLYQHCSFFVIPLLLPLPSPLISFLLTFTVISFSVSHLSFIILPPPLNPFSPSLSLPIAPSFICLFLFFFSSPPTFFPSLYQHLSLLFHPTSTFTSMSLSALCPFLLFSLFTPHLYILSPFEMLTVYAVVLFFPKYNAQCIVLVLSL